MQRDRILLMLMLLFAFAYYCVRIAIFFAGISGDMQFEEEQSDLVEDVVLYSFLGIGVAGLVLLPGLYLSAIWGFWGTMALSVYTIVFDIWAFLSVQASAIAGVIPAAIIMGYLAMDRNRFTGG